MEGVYEGLRGNGLVGLRGMSVKVFVKDRDRPDFSRDVFVKRILKNTEIGRRVFVKDRNKVDNYGHSEEFL